MLTKKQNLLETIRGGDPDRFVKQFETFGIVIGDPIADAFLEPGKTQVNKWGVTIDWPAGTPGPFPVHDEEHKVLKDITKWKEVVKAPPLDYPDEAWAFAQGMANAVDRSEQFVTAMVVPGIFEKVHYLMGIDDCLISFYEYPDEMKELLEFIGDWEIEYAKRLINKLQPEALFHHDDWGSHISSFLSPDMFEEFILPVYKRVYGFWKDNGVGLIIHHNDSYSANLVPFMIEMGIDIWQGPVTTNNVPELIKKYGEKITFMGDLDNGVIDRHDWTKERVAHEVKRACETNGKHFFIPNLTQGGPISTFPGVYEAVDEAIDNMSKKLFRKI